MGKFGQRLPAPTPGQILVGVLAVATCLYTQAAWHGIVGLYHDDGVYAVNAKSLATGQGYRTISLPDKRPQTKYPVSYPFILSLIWRLSPQFPGNALLLKRVSVLASVAFLSLSYRYFLRFGYTSPGTALGIVSLTAFSPWVLYYSSMILSDMPYAFLSLLALYGAERAGDESDIRGTSWVMGGWAGGVAGLAYLTRSAGGTVILAEVGYLIYRRQWKTGLSFLLVASLFVILWHLWAHGQRPTAEVSGLETSPLN